MARGAADAIPIERLAEGMNACTNYSSIDVSAFECDYNMAVSIEGREAASQSVRAGVPSDIPGSVAHIITPEYVSMADAGSTSV
jgi:hypothetical protein